MRMGGMNSASRISQVDRMNNKPISKPRPLIQVASLNMHEYKVQKVHEAHANKTVKCRDFPFCTVDVSQRGYWEIIIKSSICESKKIESTQGNSARNKEYITNSYNKIKNYHVRYTLLVYRNVLVINIDKLILHQTMLSFKMFSSLIYTL